MSRIREWSKIREWALVDIDKYSATWIVLSLDEDGCWELVKAIVDGDEAEKLAEEVDGVMVWCSY